MEILADVRRLERLAVQPDELSRVALCPRREHDVVHPLPLLRNTQVEPVRIHQKLRQVVEFWGELTYVLARPCQAGEDCGSTIRRVSIRKKSMVEKSTRSTSLEPHSDL